MCKSQGNNFTELTFQERAAEGARCRKWFLEFAKQKVQEKALVQEGLTVAQVLLDSGSWKTIDEYIAEMSKAPDRRRWGGFAEASVMAFHWGVRVGFFAMTEGEVEVFLLCAPAGPTDSHARICLLWTGTHYEVLQLDDATWQTACSLETAWS